MKKEKEPVDLRSHINMTEASVEEIMSALVHDCQMIMNFAAMVRAEPEIQRAMAEVLRARYIHAVEDAKPTEE